MKFGGGGGGMKDLQKMMKQAQKMQEQVMEQQAELETKEYEGVAGGVVKIVVTGKFDVKSVSIDPEVVDPEEIGELQELVQMAMNAAVKAAREEQESLMKSLSAGMGGGLPF